MILDFIRDRFRGVPLGARRDSRWEEVRNRFVKLNPLCAVCCEKKIEVHHIIPFFIQPELELDQDNFLSLCRTHHFLFGHLLSWKSYNPDVKQDCATWMTKIKGRN